MPEVTEYPGSSSRRYGQAGEYERVFRVKFDTPPSSLASVETSTGVSMMSSHPEDDSSVALGFSTRAADDAGIVWEVTISYGPKPVDGDQGGGGGEEGGGGILKMPVWSAGSSVTTTPCWQYYEDGNEDKETIVNSAGDPLEGFECEAAEFRLTLTTYHLSHAEWMGVAVEYTNAINSDIWHDCGPNTWKCQGCSAQLQSASGGVFWEVTWEFAHRDTWNLMAWDVGFNERCGEDLIASASGDKRKVIKGQDGKPVRQPAALDNNGVALAPGSKPLVINNGEGVRIYRELPFSVFGQIYTPFAANT